MRRPVSVVWRSLPARRAVAQFSVVVLVLAAVMPAVVPASSPPQPLCSVCDDSFERAGEEHGLNASITHSTVTVRIRDDGTGLWTVRNRLENQSVADRLQDDSALRDRILRTALGENYRKPNSDRLSNVSASVRNRTVVVTFAYEAFADRVGRGVLLIEYFHTTDRRSYGLVADRFSVVGPDGSQVLKRPAEGWDEDTRVTVNSDRTDGASAGNVTWATRAEEGDRYYVDAYVEETYVAFAPRDGLAQTVALRIALAEQTLPVVLGNLALLLPAGIALALGLGGYRSFVAGFFDAGQTTQLAGGVVILGLLAVAHPFYAGSVPLVNDDIPALSALGVAYVLVSAAALAVTRLGERVPWWWLLGPALATPPVAALAVTVLSYPDALTAVSETVLFGVPLAGVFPLGYAVESGDPRAKRRAGVAALALVAVLPLRFVSFTEAAALGGLVAIIATILAVLGLLFGAPLYLLGGSLAMASESSDEK